MPTHSVMIRCPQCGSMDKTITSDQVFHCTKCGADYFVNDNKTCINVKHTYQRAEKGQNAPKGTNGFKIFVIVVVSGALLVFVSLLAGGIYFMKNVNSGPRTLSSSEARQHWDYFVHDSRPVDVGGQPYIFCVCLKRILGRASESSKQQVMLFYNVNEDKIENLVPIEGIQEHTDSDISALFRDGFHYVVINKKLLYRLDPASKSVVDITETVCAMNDGLSSGIAVAEIKDAQIVLMNNQGEQFSYIPLMNRVYSNSEYRDAYEEIVAAHKPEAAGETIRCYFTDKYKSPVKLMKQSQKPHAMRGVEEDLTPGRRYFSPHIVYSDNEHLLISIRINAAEDAPIHIQKIDLSTGEPLWSTPVYTPEHFDPWYDRYYKNTILAGNTFIIQQEHRMYMTLSLDGKYGLLDWKRGSIQSAVKH